MAAFRLRVQDESAGSLGSISETFAEVDIRETPNSPFAGIAAQESHDERTEAMSPLKILKGACTVVGAAALSATVLMVALHTFTSLELPHVER